MNEEYLTKKAEAPKLGRYMFIRESRHERRMFTGKVNWVEDRGDFWYVGYEPDDHRICMFGALKIKKEGLYRAVNYTLVPVAEGGKA